MWWLLPAAGAALGATMTKKPLKGALLGGGIGAAGAYGAGLLGGASAAAPAAGIAETAAMKAGAHGLGAAGNAPALGKQVMGGLKAAGSAASAANTVQGLLGPQEPPPQPMALESRPGPDLSGFDQAQAQQMTAMLDEQKLRKLMQDRSVQGLLGGGYGSA